MSDRPDPSLRRVDIDERLDGLLGRTGGPLSERERMRLLLDAAVATTSDLSLDGVLARIVRLAGAIVEARYAALGVLAEGGDRPLRTFVHHGLAVSVASDIGDAPHGLGLLGLLIDRPEPLRLHEIAEHPASFGFPAHHPPMRSFLGVPVRSRGRVFGNLYLTEKAGGGEFTAEDEEMVVALAAAAGVAIENARLYQEARHRQHWLEATALGTSALAGDGATSEVLDALAHRAMLAADADSAWLVLRSSHGPSRVAALAGALPGDLDDLTRPGTSTAQILSEADAEADAGGLAGSLEPRGPLGGPQLVVPLRTDGAALGVLGIAWAHERAGAGHDLDPDLPRQHAHQLGLALEVARARDNQQRLAVLEERDRIARDLHDVVIQRLFAVSLGLDSLTRRLEDPQTAGRVSRAVDELDQTVKDIRRTIFALNVPAHAGDVQSRISLLVERARATLKFRPSLTFEGPVRSVVVGEVAEDVLAVLAEALSNAGRHASADTVEVTVAAGRQICLTVTDDGAGFDDTRVAHSGLENLRRRAEDRGGTLEVRSTPGRGTQVVWTVPAPPRHGR
ncbi:GAF domain-containing protein [Nocardioidaceae bacterium]|nr:GAF domain-containing protein [Nocardioidaceae bacterium]